MTERRGRAWRKEIMMRSREQEVPERLTSLELVFLFAITQLALC